jgi:hypothetical protein
MDKYILDIDWLVINDDVGSLRNIDSLEID